MKLRLRTGLLTFAGALALGGLATLAPISASANSPSIRVIGGPAEVALDGNGWSPGAIIQMHVVNPLLSNTGQEQIVNIPESRFLIASPLWRDRYAAQ
jgi:hypothetical protein